MRRLTACFAFLLLLASCTSSKPAPSNADPTGTWSGNYGSSPDRRDDVTLELKWDNTDLHGVVRAGPRSLPLEKTTFKPETGAIRMEFDAQGNGRTVHYTIDGKVSGDTMTGTWNHDEQTGDFHVTRSK